jgi:hypothetical protein
MERKGEKKEKQRQKLRNTEKGQITTKTETEIRCRDMSVKSYLFERMLVQEYLSAKGH